MTPTLKKIAGLRNANSRITSDELNEGTVNENMPNNCRIIALDVYISEKLRKTKKNG